MTRLRQTIIAGTCLLVGGLAAGLAGCSAVDSITNWWSDDTVEPPGARSSSARLADGTPRTTVLLGDFRNPATASVGWNDIGTGMTGALNRAMLNDGRFDVRLDASAAARVAAAAEGRSTASLDQIQALRERFPAVEYVVVGVVTDFHQPGAPVGKNDEPAADPEGDAVVAVELKVIDLKTLRIVAMDHIVGSADASGSTVGPTYRDMRFGSYRFWSTPLGRSSKRVVEDSVTRLAEIAPSRRIEIRVTRVINHRSIEIAAGTSLGVKEGQRLYLCERAGETGALRPVRDPLTDLPLMARITRTEENRATAYLMGETPEPTTLSRAVLLHELPVPKGLVSEDPS